MRDFKRMSHGWHNILTLRLERPDNTEHEQRLNLDPEDFKGKWGELVVGEFNSGDSTGRVTFGLFDIESGQWKGGLVVKGVMVRPVRAGSA
ncbi:Protein PHLOEM PROTEIN 2-LIKE A2 [Acorus calamus]|uniref:Protein PHLOEM PROTEIN 2-LIKE A2 n=1 Tax=Acorus calamus TaxID=4465 RepID=A0AAV9D494_ACOCL|nr:Protein PHLOEM PROTEIN 2-LIKE A2 [Acorus calamus]